MITIKYKDFKYTFFKDLKAGECFIASDDGHLYRVMSEWCDGDEIYNTYNFEENIFDYFTSYEKVVPVDITIEMEKK